LLFQHFFCNEANSLLPVFFLIRLDIDGQVKFEIVFVVCSEGFELIFQQNVSWSPASENKLQFSTIVVLQSSLNDLIDWSNSRSSSDTADFLFAENLFFGNNKVTKSVILKSSFWSFHLHYVTNFHIINVLTHNTAIWESWHNIGKINFYQKVDVPFLAHHANRSIFSADQFSIWFSFCFDISRENNVFADRKA